MSWLRLGLFLSLLAWWPARAAAAEAPAATNAPRARVLLVAGAPGAEEFGAQFAAWASHWEAAARKANASFSAAGLATSNSAPDREQLEAWLKAEPKETATELWLVFLGHGTYDGKDAKFNLRGPDLTAAELAAWLLPFHRPVAVIVSASASGPFLNALSAPNRVIITATRAGSEQNYSRFGQFLSEAIDNPQTDLDKDGQVSLLEAYLYASRQTAEFYKLAGRLATEHALLDDNGDAKGTPADWFRGVRAVKKARENVALDGALANRFHLVQNAADRGLSLEKRQRRDELETAVESLIAKKIQLSEDDYYNQLEKLMLELSEFYP